MLKSYSAVNSGCVDLFGTGPEHLITFPFSSGEDVTPQCIEWAYDELPVALIVEDYSEAVINIEVIKGEGAPTDGCMQITCPGRGNEANFDHTFCARPSNQSGKSFPEYL